mmetsp:Transcript_427/g.612  ORF Transcript_427/g.612 Transcript_427/m.612 type:complete len:204 (-) Transcript_427:176-787(-)
MMLLNRQAALVLFAFAAGKASGQTCDEIESQGTKLVETDSGCTLVKALFDGTDILDGTPQQVKDVCNANPRCAEQLIFLVTTAKEETCQLTTQMNDIDQYGEDVILLTNYFCTSDCYAETKAAIASGSGKDASCECLLAYQVTAALLTAPAKGWLGVTDDLPYVEAASKEKGCGSPSSAPTRVSKHHVMMAVLALAGFAVAYY